MYRQALVRNVRLFSTSVRMSKGPVEATKDAVKTVDRTVSNAAVKGIEKGEQVVESAKQATGTGAKQAADKTKEAADATKAKAEEAKQKL